MGRYLATVVVIVAALFDGFVSGASLPTVAVLVIVPVRLGVTTIVTVRLSPGASVPRSHWTLPAAWVHVADALANVTSAGSTSRTVAFGAAFVPLFVAVSE